jgi:hypothetical protein
MRRDSDLLEEGGYIKLSEALWNALLQSSEILYSEFCFLYSSRTGSSGAAEWVACQRRHSGLSGEALHGAKVAIRAFERRFSPFCNS